MKMLLGVAGVCVGVLVACTKPNPLSCTDGSCTDPALPFCDMDGALSGTAGTCVSGDCTPNEVQACRGKTAVVCNADGTNYDLKDCASICDQDLGCIECIDDSQCSSAAEPHCDATTHACRGCEADAECASNVCSTTAGTCVDAATLIYAAPTGSTAGNCGTQQFPCDLPTAVAHADTVKNVVKLETGDYAVAPITVTNNRVVTILGGGSTVRGSLMPPLIVQDGGRLSLQNVTVDPGISCNTNTTNLPELNVRDATIGQSGIGMLACKLVASRTVFQSALPNATNGIRVSALAGGSVVTVDRCTFRGSLVTASGAGNTISIVNSVFDGTGTTFGSGLQFEQGIFGTISFSTMVNAPVSCVGSGTITLANNIMFGTTADDVLYQQGATCPVHYSLMNPQNSVYTSWDHVLRNVDPLLTSLPNHNLHLLATSPAIDAADPAAGLSTDIEGTPRPQGTRLDLGAFEYK